jgi:hypothetical protein
VPDIVAGMIACHVATASRRTMDGKIIQIIGRIIQGISVGP